MSVEVRKEDLTVIAKAKKILVETTSGALRQTSLMQMATATELNTRSHLAHAEVGVLVKRLALVRRWLSLDLAQRLSCNMEN